MVIAPSVDVNSKFIFLVRHGDLIGKRIYNRDSVMDESDRMHLSVVGEMQMRAVSNVLARFQFENIRLWLSPEIRAMESAAVLMEDLDIGEYRVVNNLDDNYAPGPYREGMTLDEYITLKGDVYDTKRWAAYNHETPERIIVRMTNVYHQMAASLSLGQCGILLSHGDPLAWLINFLLLRRIPKPSDLRDEHYPAKGTAVATATNNDNEIVRHWIINGHIDSPMEMVY